MIGNGGSAARVLRMGSRASVVTFATVCAVTVAVGMAFASSWTGYGATTRVSVSSGGVQGNGHTVDPAVSSDGRYVAFESYATNLVPGDTNGRSDVFLHDLASGETTRASVSSAGAQGNYGSRTPAVSANGRYVAFESYATNLVSADTNGAFDVFLHDLASGETTRASVSSAGAEGDNASIHPALSYDGRYVAFESQATNLVSGDTSSASDVFVRDLASGQTKRVSVSSAGAEGDNASIHPALSSDGRYVAFESQATNLVPGDTNGLSDVFVRDLAGGETTRVSVSSAGAEGNSYGSSAPAISSDGRYVAFQSGAANLVPGDANSSLDVFVRDLANGATTRVSVSNAGAEGNSYSYDPAVSSDGRYVAFESYATNLVPGDTNGRSDVFVRDLASGETTRASVSSAGAQGNYGGRAPAVSANGRYVAFWSPATNLVSGDTNYHYDVFVRDLMAPGSIAVISASKTLSRYGNAYTLAGSLTSSGTPLADRRVLLETAPSASGPWSTSSVAASTTAGGTFSLSEVPRSKTYYRAYFAGDEPYGELRSDVRFALPVAWVGTPVAPSTMYASRAKTVYGYLKPRHTARTYPVRIYRHRYVSGKWRGYGYVRAKAYHYSTYTRYAASVRLPYRGRWRLRAHHAADAGHAASWSAAYDYLTVR